ncbi:MAG: glycosyltransferase [Bacteroidota bacterium]
MRILFIAAWWPSRVHPTHGNFVQKHARLVAKGYELAVLAIQADPNLPDEKLDWSWKEEEGYQLLQIYFGQPDETPSLKKIWNRVNAYRIGMRQVVQQFGKPDILHGHILLDGGIAAAIWAQRWRRPFVITAHSSAYQHPKALPGIRGWLSRWTCRTSRTILTVSNYLAHCMQEKNGLKGHYQTISNVVDTTLFSYQPPPAPLPFTFLHVSNFHEPAKNITGLLRAFQRAFRQENNLRLKLAGDGDLTTLRAKVAATGLPDFAVSLSGPHTEREIAQLMQASHAFVLFSHYETQSVVLLEAQASGRPCIATKVGGIPEVIPSDDYGKLVPPEDEIALANALLEVYQNYNSFDPILIRKRAIAWYSEEAILATHKRVYQEALQSQNR